MRFYKYQIDYTNSTETFDIINKSRQIGYSSGAIARKAVYRCLLGIDQLLVSSSQRQSNKLMSYCESHIEKLQGTEFKLTKDSTTQKTFGNGKSIYCFPSKPETVRGFPGDVRLDEFALHREDRKIFEAMLPSISSNNKFQLSIASTPLGCSNMFHEIFTNRSNNYPDFNRLQINCWDAIKMGCQMNIEMIKRNFDEESFRQEFECEFIDETTSYFSYDLLKSCIEEYDTVHGASYMGIDIGRTTDRTGIAVMTEAKEKYYLSKLETLANKDFNTQKFTIKQMYQDYGILGARQDAGAIGYQIAEELEQELAGYKRVFTNQTAFMSDVITFTKKLMEQGKVKFNEDRDLINDFHKIQKTVTVNNNISFKIERDKSGHGDRAIAVMLALYCFKDQTEPNFTTLDFSF